MTQVDFATVRYRSHETILWAKDDHIYSIYPIRTDARIMVTTCDNWTHGYLQWDSQCNQLNYIANNQQHYVVWHCCMLLLMCYGFLCREIVLWWFFDGSYCVCCRTRKKIAHTTAQTQKIIHTYTHTWWQRQPKKINWIKLN